ncbi:MAG: Aminotransferase, partial [Bacteroidetes bacterium]|nr:Aminotransferase [Bacteroidota bacterium]
RERAGIVTIKLPANVDPKAVFKRLMEKNITTGLRSGLLRYSPHFYCSPEEMRMTVAATREKLEEK